MTKVIGSLRVEQYFDLKIDWGLDKRACWQSLGNMVTMQGLVKPYIMLGILKIAISFVFFFNPCVHSVSDLSATGTKCYPLPLLYEKIDFLKIEKVFFWKILCLWFFESHWLDQQSVFIHISKS
jgi:hypothetical protein